MAKTKYRIPAAVGERLNLTVETLGSSGDGICRYQGYALFIPSGLPGDEVLGEVTKTTPRFGVIKIIQLLKESPDRTDPRCPVFSDCGGCKFQDLKYEKQISFKVRVVADSLRHIAGLRPPAPIKPIASERTFRYRNKGSFAVQRIDGIPRIGFFREGSHEVADSDSCDILLKPINVVKEWIRELLNRHEVSIYDESAQTGALRGLVIRHSESAGKTLVGLVTTNGTLGTHFLDELLAPYSLERFQISGVVQNINSQNTNVILGNKNVVLKGRERLDERLGTLRFQLSLGSFFQVNSAQAVRLYDLIRSWAEPSGGTILDAYCGTGGIALWLAKSGGRVIGIEEYSPAVEDAQNSARLNGIDSASFLAGTVEQHLPRIIKNDPIQTLIFDPPRKGCSQAVLAAIPHLNPERIIYVSCNPSTLARDLSRIQGYEIADIRMIDMFPQTRHIETAVLLIRD